MTFKKIERWKKQNRIVKARGKIFQGKSYIIGMDTLRKLHFLGL